MIILLLLGVSFSFKCCSDKFKVSTDLYSYRHTIFESGGADNLRYSPCNFGVPYNGVQCDSHAAGCLETPTTSHPLGDKLKGEWKSATQIYYPPNLGIDGVRRSLSINIICSTYDSKSLTYSSSPSSNNTRDYFATIHIDNHNCGLSQCDSDDTGAAIAVILLFMFCCCCVPICCCVAFILMVASVIFTLLKVAASEAMDENVLDILYGKLNQQYSAVPQPFGNRPPSYSEDVNL